MKRCHERSMSDWCAMTLCGGFGQRNQIIIFRFWTFERCKIGGSARLCDAQ